MYTNRIWVFGFLLLYALHAIFLSIYQARFHADIPPSLALMGAALTLVAMLAMIFADFLKRDEVVQKMALLGGSAAAIISGLYTFGLDLISVTNPFPVWAVSLLVFLIVYGGLQWRAKL